jgi:hypothetical protein
VIVEPRRDGLAVRELEHDIGPGRGDCVQGTRETYRLGPRRFIPLAFDLRNIFRAQDEGLGATSHAIELNSFESVARGASETTTGVE